MASAICDAFQRFPEDVCPKLNTIKYDEDNVPDLLQKSYEKGQWGAQEDESIFALVLASILVIICLFGASIVLVQRIFITASRRDLEMNVDHSVASYRMIKEDEVTEV